MTTTPGGEQTLYEVQNQPINPLNKTHVRVTNRYMYFEKGTLRSNAQQVPVSAIFDVDATQSMIQKSRGVGSVTVNVARGPQREIVLLEDMPDHRTLVMVLNDVSNAARFHETQLRNTQHIQHGGATPFQQSPAPQPLAPQGPTADEIMGQLRQLGELRDAGIITAAEFDAKKAELLARL